jgi:DNA-binding MarR family transcriptional regulator
MTLPTDDSEGQQPVPAVDRLFHEPARFLVMANLYVVDAADYLFLQRQTGLTWGNISSHLSKLEAAGYVEMAKGFKGKRPHTMLRLTEEGRSAFRKYRDDMRRVLDELPE